MVMAEETKKANIYSRKKTMGFIECNLVVIVVYYALTNQGARIISFLIS